MIVALDIGTSKVVVLVAEVGPDGTIEVVGIGSHPSRGMKKGVVINIESTVLSIQRAVEEAELMAGCEIHSVYAVYWHQIFLFLLLVYNAPHKIPQLHESHYLQIQTIYSEKFVEKHRHL